MSRSGQHFWIWVFVAFLIGGTALGLWLAGRANQTQHASTTGFRESLPPNVTLRLRTVHITGRANGIPAWNLRAGRVDAARGQNQVTFTEGIEADFLQNGQTRAKVSAPTAVYKVSAKQVEASGGVTCRVVGPKLAASDELAIKTPQVTWSIGARQINCPGEVTVAQPRAKLHGTNLSVDLITREYRIHTVSAEFVVDEEDGPAQLFNVLPSTE